MAKAAGRFSTSTPLNVIALISGGKDSFLSLLHCLALGHNVVALANLYPQQYPSIFNSSDTETSDLNSYMYQTAGHTLIPLYSQVLSIPLYRGPITGIALSTSKEYEHPSTSAESRQDGREPREETEDLLPLLRQVKAEHPKANALCSGAILSTYQRTRVESICSQLHLTSLSFLWQWPVLPSPTSSPGALLEDGARVGLDARIVKVASGGLDETFLWESLADPEVRRRVEIAVGKFGGSVVGEGGEYESLVIEGPQSLWSGRIEVAENEREVKRGGGGEAWLQFRKGSAVELRPKYECSQDEWKERVRMPQLWDEEFEVILSEKASLGPLPPDGIDQFPKRSWEPKVQYSDHGDTFSLSNITPPPIQARGIEDQMDTIKATISRNLATRGAEPSDIIFATIVLGSMGDFSIVNSIYAQLFTAPNPPARVTIACGHSISMGEDEYTEEDISISVLVHKKPRHERRGLHVQSQSYWAPANIGPYSQAISVDADPKSGNPASQCRIVYIAGQIPLVPATMEVFTGDADETPATLFRKQALLALQHLWRIGREMEVNWWSGGVAFIASRGNSEHETVAPRAEIAWSLWKRLHKLPLDKASSDGESGDVLDRDIWDLKHGSMRTFANEEVQKRPLPDFGRVQLENTLFVKQSRSIVPPEYLIPGFFAVEVAQLPRSCSVEWQATGYCGDNMGLFHGSTDSFSHKRLRPERRYQIQDPFTDWTSVTSTLYFSQEDRNRQEGTDSDNSRESADSWKNANFTSTIFTSIPLGVLKDQHRDMELFKTHLDLAMGEALKYSEVESFVTIYTPFPYVFSHCTGHIIPCSRVLGIYAGKLIEVGAGVVTRVYGRR